MYRTGGSTRFSSKRSYINKIDGHKDNAGTKKQGNSSLVGVTRNLWFNIKHRCHHNSYNNIYIPNKVKEWWEEQVLLFNLPYDFIYLYLSGIPLQQLIQLVLPNNSEFSMTNLDCSLPNVTCLNQTDFDNGPVIIREPGIYRLDEDIVFSPFIENNGKPTTEWLNLLPENERKAYTLGIFAAIIIQSDNVCFDLNKKTIKQSELFFHQQTFYSHIELASTPFIRKQGPADFGEHVEEANNVFITNGTLGLSSHHGIHGNLCKNCILNDLTFEEFAVAAIHLNGSHNIVLNNIVCDNSAIDIKINSLFSQAQFILELLKASTLDDDSFITIHGVDKTLSTIKENLQTDIDEVYDCINNNIPYTSDKVFHNSNGKLDANMYGIVFNTKGIAIKGFKDLRENDDCGNSNIVLNNVMIKNIESKGTEIKILTDTTSDNNDSSYGSGGFVGPVGDVFDFEKATDIDKSYKSNCLADAQLFAAKYSINSRVKIPQPLLDWAADSTSNIDNVITDNNYYILDGRDSMNHVMKGNIGLFIQQAYRVITNHLIIDTVKNTSISENMDAASSHGVLFSGSKDIKFNHYQINNIQGGIHGDSNLITHKMTNKNITL